ncbi:MAG TPA: hypothetical protein VMS21_09415 [Methylomirabilota bacterium]|nr:hypothetical protein [Methylomirabilota bacterium]
MMTSTFLTLFVVPVVYILISPRPNPTEATSTAVPATGAGTG